MKPLTIHQIAASVEGKVVNEYNLSDAVSYTGVSIDSRSINQDEIFIPIKGENFDGHQFIDMAYKKGASISFTESEDYIPKDKCGILVKNTKEGLINFARYYRSLFHIPIIAITGSVGKTSCKEMIASVLSMKYSVLKTEGNYNNDIGLPLTIFGLKEEHEVAVLEMGMNHYGELHLLSHIAKPDIAVITNIGTSHIENFGSKEGILKAKSEILDYLNPEGLVVLNGDDDYLQKLKTNLKFKINTFGFEPTNDYYVKQSQSLGWEGIHAIIKSNSHELDITIKEIGRHMLYNTLPAVIIGFYLNMDENQIRQGISCFQNAKMRMNKVTLGSDITVINDAYNASVDSMRSALETLSNLNTRGRKAAILGDMFEMGDYSREAHEQVGKIVAASKIDVLLCVGDYAKWIYQSAKNNGFKGEHAAYYGDREALEKQLHSLIKEKDTVIVKASRGMYLEKIIDSLAYIFGN